MDKRIVWIVVGVAVLGAGFWWMTRTSDAPAEAESPSAATPESATPAAADRAPAASPAAATNEPAAPTSPPASADHPIDVSPGFEYLSSPAGIIRDTDPRWSNWRRHQVLQIELRDESWAPRMEDSLRKTVEDALTARGLDTQRIELPVIECRTNACEIQAVGWNEDSRPGGYDLQRILFDALAGNLATDINRDEFSIMMTSRQSDDRVLFLVHLPRKKP